MLKMIYKQNGILGEMEWWKINDECTIIVDLSCPKYSAAVSSNIRGDVTKYVYDNIVNKNNLNLYELIENPSSGHRIYFNKEDLNVLLSEIEKVYS